MKDIIKRTLVAFMVLSVMMAGGAVAASDWESDVSDNGTVSVVQGTEDVKQNYTVEINTTGLTVGEQIGIVSLVNASEINNSSVSVSGPASVNENTNGWTTQSNTGYYYRIYNVSSTGSNVTFNVTNGAIFGGDDANTSIPTGQVTNGTIAYAGGAASEGGNLTLNAPSQLDNTIEYEIIDHPVQPDGSFSADVENATSVDNGTVQVDPAATEVTYTVDVNDTADYNNSDSATVTLVVNESFALSSNIAVSVDGSDNATVSGPSTYPGSSDHYKYTVTVDNVSNNTSVVAVANASSWQNGDMVQSAIWSEVDYDAEVLGDTTSMSPAYTLDVTRQAGSFSGGTILPVPSFLQTALGDTLGSAIFWMMVIGAALETVLALFLLREGGYLTTSKDKAVAYGGLSFAALFSIFGVTMSQMLGWLVVVYWILITAVVIYLYINTQNATMRDAGGGGGSTAWIE